MSDKTKTPITIEQAKKVRQAFQSALEGGQIVPQKALITKQIEAVSSESGTIQETPFISQGTGTANGTSVVDTSPVGKHLEKQGNTIVYNQKVANNLKSTTVTVENDLTGTTWLDRNVLIPAVSTAQVGHKLLFIMTGTSSTIKYSFLMNGKSFTGTSIYTVLATDLYNTVPPQMAFGILGYSGLTAGTYTLGISIIDLSQWFGSNDNIPQDLLDHPENAARYGITSDIAYNTGTLTNSNGRYLECGQSRNIWDEVVSNESSIGADGSIVSDLHKFASTNLIPVIPNNPYYFKMPYSIAAYFIRIAWYDKNKNVIDVKNMYTATNIIVSPENAWYMRFATGDGSTTYNHDITISLYYATGDSYDEYFPYVAPKTYDTGTEVLRSAGTVRDRKGPDGIIKRIISSVKLNTLAFTEYTLSNNRTAFSVSGFSSNYGAKALSYPWEKANILCGGAITVSQDDTWVNGDVCILAIQGTAGNAGDLAFIVTTGSFSDATAFKNHFTDDDILYYELATPTTEQGTPFSENIEINDYSYMAWNDTNDDLVEIPQGCKIFYPADYVLFLDSLGQREDVEWDASVVAVKNDTKLYKHNVYLHLYNNSVDVRLYLSFVSRSSTQVTDSFIDANFDIMQVDTKNSIDEVDFTTKPIKLLECAFATGGGTCKVLEWTGSAVIEKSLTGNGATDTVTEFTGS